MQVGLNLFSIRDLIKTEESFETTAQKLKEMGYDFLQFSGAPFDAPMIKRVSEKTGIPIALTHVPADRIIDDTDALTDEHLSFGCKNIGLGHLSPAIIENEDEGRAYAEKLNGAGRRIAEKGCKFFYHNHHSELYKWSNGKTFLEYLLENCPYINFTLDTYWLQFGGVSVLEYVKKFKGRIECVHLKDYTVKIDENKKGKPDFAPVGSGNINFCDIIPEMINSGVKYFIVEQDNANAAPDPLAQVEMSVKYLKENF